MNNIKWYILVSLLGVVSVLFILWSPALAHTPGGEFHVFAFPGQISLVSQAVDQGPEPGLTRVVFQVIGLTDEKVFYLDLDREGKVAYCRGCQVDGNKIRPGWYQALYDKKINGFVLRRVSK